MKKMISFLKNSIPLMLSVLLVLSCDKDDEKGKGFTPTKTGNSEGSIAMTINGKKYDFIIYNISITQEFPDVLYRFLISAESENEDLSLYIYQDQIGEYRCGQTTTGNGIFNFMLSNKTDGSMIANYVSIATSSCKLSIDQLVNYEYMERDNQTFQITNPGSLDLIEGTFEGVSSFIGTTYTVTDGVYSGGFK
ncbi:MAG: hypothetical protein EA358_01435 [Flavobacteriales bacterium]|nr:MAG: hypothetical protein EA358_01435 [Flavobacteriales bacterium]